MSKPVNSILIVGGGTAGWLTAAILAAKHAGHNFGENNSQKNNSGMHISLIEAPDIPIIGVGEGTWPTMRGTLHSLGIKEEDFLKACHASFKQGSKFVGWKDGSADDYYYHPFDLPQGFLEGNLAQYWVNTAGLDNKTATSFSKMACPQEHLCEKDLSPKLRSSGNYSGVANYGYHLDAGTFSEFLKAHCVEKLGVHLIKDKVIGVISQDNGDIAHVQTEHSGDIAADLFIDCSGFRSLLLGQHFGIPFLDKSAELPINSALAVQVPYGEDRSIKSATISTAQEAGWIWDIGLSTRRGVGHVYCDRYVSQQQAAVQLRNYLGMNEQAFEQLTPRSIDIKPGYRETFWHKNCAAIGLAAGFLEPLEASAMMLIEASANMIADQMPVTRTSMDVLSKRFNKRCHYRWQRIIDFLKLHYALSHRQEPFWREASAESSLSERLKEDLQLWQQQAPWKTDFDSIDEAFPAASYQYVLYGMGFKTQSHAKFNSPILENFSRKAINNMARNLSLITPKVESNRTLLDMINANS